LLKKSKNVVDDICCDVIYILHNSVKGENQEFDRSDGMGSRVMCPWKRGKSNGRRPQGRPERGQEARHPRDIAHPRDGVF
jgi:hypothetical protein